MRKANFYNLECGKNDRQHKNDDMISENMIRKETLLLHLRTKGKHKNDGRNILSNVRWGRWWIKSKKKQKSKIIKKWEIIMMDKERYNTRNPFPGTRISLIETTLIFCQHVDSWNWLQPKQSYQHSSINILVRFRDNILNYRENAFKKKKNCLCSLLEMSKLMNISLLKKKHN